LYNATRLIELTEFARTRGLTIHWQSLYQPKYLDPARLGPEILDLARNQISRLLEMNICLANETEFFEKVISELTVKDNLTSQFQQHIYDIEIQYHNDQIGQFKKLWPEIYNVL
jgi:hypothetical protein